MWQETEESQKPITISRGQRDGERCPRALLGEDVSTPGMMKGQGRKGRRQHSLLGTIWGQHHGSNIWVAWDGGLPNNPPQKVLSLKSAEIPQSKEKRLSRKAWMSSWLWMIHGPHLQRKLPLLKAPMPCTSILGGLPLYWHNTHTGSHLFISQDSRLSSAHKRTVGTEVFADEGWSARTGLRIAPAGLSLASISATALNPPTKALTAANPAKYREGKQEIIYIHHKSQHTVTPCTSALEGQKWLKWVRLLAIYN